VTQFNPLKTGMCSPPSNRMRPSWRLSGGRFPPCRSLAPLDREFGSNVAHRERERTPAQRCPLTGCQKRGIAMTLFRARQVPKRHAMSRRRHAEGPLPDARRQEHRAAHGGGPRAVAQSWLEARILLGRGKSRTRRGPGYHARAKGAYSPRSLNGRRSLKGAAGDSSTTRSKHRRARPAPRRERRRTG